MNQSPAAQAPSCAKIIEHYNHAREKHPYFCDRVLPVESIAEVQEEIQEVLAEFRRVLNTGCKQHQSAAYDIACCEMVEFAEAYARGDTAAAIEECYDAIAVLLRVIDVLEGRQPLGKPKEGAK